MLILRIVKFKLEWMGFMKFKINWIDIGIYVMLSILIALAWMLIVNTGKLPALFYLDPQKISIDNLMYYTWQVQVTIALISISLTSLIISKLDRKVYGQSVKEILMITKKLQLTYIDKIILVILLSVLNLWFIMYGILPALIVVFIISIVGVLDLIIDSYNILLNPEKYEDKVKKYINSNLIEFSKEKPNRLSKLIENIELNNKQLISLNNISALEMNITYLLEISNELNDMKMSNKESLNELLFRIEKSIINTVKFSTEYNDIESVIKTINRIMNKNFKYNNKQQLINELLYTLINKTKTNCSEEIYHKINKYILIDIFDNIDLKVIEKLFLSDCQSKCFYWIYKNDNLNGFLREEIINKFINLLVPSEFGDLDSDEYFVRKHAIYYISKRLIINNEKEIFGELFKALYKSNSFSVNLNKPNKIYEIIITINIFIYYISVKEDACEDEFKKNVESFLTFKADNQTKYNLNIRDFATRIGIYIWDCYKDIKEEMLKSNWEYCPNGLAKQLIITNAIDEYFLFYSIVNIEYYDYNDYISKNFDVNICQTILGYFKRDETLKDDVMKNFSSFVKMYSINLNEDELYNKMNILYNITSRLYSKFVIEQQKEYYQLDKVEENIKKIREDAIEKLKNNDFYTLNDGKNINGQKYSFKTELSTGVLAEKIYLSGISYQDLIVYSIEEKILDLIRQSAYYFIFSYKDENKIEKLLRFINEKNFLVGSIINSRPSDDWNIIHNEKSHELNKLKKFEERMQNHYNLTNYKTECIILNNKEFNIQIKITQIKIQDIDENYILEMLNQIPKDTNNYYKVNVVNDIYTLFEENEIKEYFAYKYKTLDVSFKIKHNIKVNDAIVIKREQY